MKTRLALSVTGGVGPHSLPLTPPLQSHECCSFDYDLDLELSRVLDYKKDLFEVVLDYVIVCL